MEAEEGALKLKVGWLITKEMEEENFAMRLFAMEPKGHTPLDSHPWEHEVLILKEKGLLLGEGEERSFKKGDVIFIAPNEKHQLKNISEETVKFLCLIPYTRKLIWCVLTNYSS